MLDKFFKLLWPGTRRAFASNGILLAEKFSSEGEEGIFLNVMSSNGGFDARHTALWCSCSQRIPTRLMSQFGRGRSFAMLFHFENHRKTPLAAAVAAAACWVCGTGLNNLKCAKGRT